MLSPVSTWMGDRLGTLDAVGFSFLHILVLFSNIFNKFVILFKMFEFCSKNVQNAL